jgi:hypothetical protein
VEEKIFSLFSDAVFSILHAAFLCYFLPLSWKKIKKCFLRDDYLLKLLCPPFFKKISFNTNILASPFCLNGLSSNIFKITSGDDSSWQIAMFIALSPGEPFLKSAIAYFEKIYTCHFQ